MDGFRLGYLLIPILCVFGSHAHAATDQCAWSTAHIGPETLGAEYEKAKAAAAGSCADETPSIRLGVKEAFAIAAKSCTPDDHTEIKNSQFLYHAMKLQGLKLTPDQGLKHVQELKPAQLKPSNLFKNYPTLGCLKDVSEQNELKKGDILVSQSEVIVLDEALNLSDDPFGINVKLLSIGKDANAISDEPTSEKIYAEAKKICADVTADPQKINFSIYQFQGHSKLFPRYGHSSSIWMTTVSEWGKRLCAESISNTLAKLNGIIFDEKVLNSPGKPQFGVVALRYNAQKAGCRAPKKDDDSDCVRYCNLKEEP